jgi:hypothetical protein
MIRSIRYLPLFLFMLPALQDCQQGSNVHPNMKDLGENMMDIRIYHENLGGAIKRADFDEADWLLAGMDSILLVVGDKFQAHRKLDGPFSAYYVKRLKEPIGELRSSIEKKDRTAAVHAYTLLTQRCNKCHLDREVEKEVQNWAK